jgi:exosortase K
MSATARRLLPFAAIALAMYVLKRHYSIAPVEDLRWILWPTSALVSLLGGAAFAFERGAGYVSREHFFVIEKSCAGLNFMIAALGMIGFALAGGAGRARSIAGVVARSLALGYAATVLVNALRILIALRLASADLASGWWTAGRIHRVEGIAVYFGGLWLLSLAARAWLDGRRSAAPVASP